MALFQIVSAACLYVAGRLSDRMSPHLVLTGGLAIAGVGSSLMSLMAAPWHALILYGVVFAIGNGVASIIPVGVMVTRALLATPATGASRGAGGGGGAAGQMQLLATIDDPAVILRVLAHLGLPGAPGPPQRSALPVPDGHVEGSHLVIQGPDLTSDPRSGRIGARWEGGEVWVRRGW